MKGNLFNAAATFLGGICLFMASAQVTGAYLTSVPDALVNIITPGDIKVKLTEPQWDPQKGRELVPRSAVAKDPTATNTGKNEEWIFLKVSVPIRRIVVVDPDSKKKQEASEVELFSFSVLNGWKLVNEQRAENAMEYTYGYEKIVRPGESTAPLFSKVSLVNYLEGELDAEEELRLPVEAMSIQGSACPESANIKDIYEEYLRQIEENEKGGDDSATEEE